MGLRPGQTGAATNEYIKELKLKGLRGGGERLADASMRRHSAVVAAAHMEPFNSAQVNNLSRLFCAILPLPHLVYNRHRCRAIEQRFHVYLLDNVKTLHHNDAASSIHLPLLHMGELWSGVVV